MVFVIKTKKDYIFGQKAGSKLFLMQKGSPNANKLELLSMLIEDYETRIFTSIIFKNLKKFECPGGANCL